MPIPTADLWTLTRGNPHIDAESLAVAIEHGVQQAPLDFRTKLLIRDSLDALQSHWGRERLADWLDHSPASESLREIWKADLGEAGFPTLERRIMDAIKPDVVMQLLRELGSHISHPVRLEIGGAIALILSGNLSRHTDDIDIVNEVPAEIRNQHDLLNQLARRYGLLLTHFQSHFLPGGWQNRVKSLGRFGSLDVFLVDVVDVFVGKLFSQRTKDLDDLRMLVPGLQRSNIEQRLIDSAGDLMADPTLAQNAGKNWYILFGDELPSVSSS
jgi:hypothetical protein